MANVKYLGQFKSYRDKHTGLIVPCGPLNCICQTRIDKLSDFLAVLSNTQCGQFLMGSLV